MYGKLIDTIEYSTSIVDVFVCYGYSICGIGFIRVRIFCSVLETFICSRIQHRGGVSEQAGRV